MKAVVVLDPEMAPLIPAFLDSRRRLVADVRKALAKGKLEDVRRHAHQVSGGFRMYGFAAAGEVAAKLESAAGLGERERTEKFVEWLEDFLKSVEVRYSLQEKS